MEREDGEMSDEESMVVDDDDIKKELIEPRKDFTVLYKSEKDSLIIKTLEKVDASKLEERAKRFGINLKGHRIITQKQIDELYTNFGIESGNERHFRFDTLHLRGVDGLTTREIFEYLEDYKPVSLEWIDGTSCNVVCADHVSTALALLVHSREIRDQDLKNMIAKSSTYHWREGMPHEKKDFILMRFATKSDKKDLSKKHEPKRVFERLDIDQNMDSVSKDPWGDLCQSWGVYDHQEILSHKPITDSEDELKIPNEPVQIKNKSLAKRLGKRTHKSEESGSDSDSEWTKRQKAPRMRMHADDEESKQKKKQLSPDREYEEKEIYAPLSIEVVNTNFSYSPKEVTKLSDKFRSHGKTNSILQKDGIHSRLGLKIQTSDKAPVRERKERDRGWSSDESSDKLDHNVMSRVQIVGKKKNSSDVWSRLETQPEESSNNDLRNILKSRRPLKSSDLREKRSSSLREKKSSDLRARIGKPKEGITFKSKEGISLRVEIDNEYHISG